ncbi:MAG: hypothetical protein D6719_11265 [Candidatus Dadabacteria bacterium]|nr:MAG: hypothetical protein D6719_11265 [Candidatus Dadabacteria bacterium]
MSAVILSGCNKFTAPDSEEALIKKAFRALKNSSWEDYESVTITSADIQLKKMGISKFKARQSFTGGVQKEIEIKKQRRDFDKAVSMDDPDYIDFSEEALKYISKGRLIKSSEQRLLTGGSIPVKVYAARVKTGGQEFDDLPPYFKITKWKGRDYLLGLEF